MKLEKVVASTAKGKKFTAIFCMCEGKSCCEEGDKKKFILVQVEWTIIPLQKIKNNANDIEKDIKKTFVQMIQ
jgi:GTP-sensing pleiotropic transcriptional regulator CodY